MGPLQRCDWLYPPIRRPRQRRRTLAWLARERFTWTVTTEHGEHYDCPSWHDARELTSDSHLTCFTSFGSTVHAFPWLSLAVNDKQANVLISKRGAVHGVQVHAHNHYGAFISAESWGFTDLQEWNVTPAVFLALVRHFLTLCAVGDYDTLGTVAEQTLFHYWQEQGIRRITTLHGRLQDWFQQFPAAGRVLAPTDTARMYEHLWEVDLRSAYPREFARGVPWGDAWLAYREDALAHSAASHGLYTVRLHDDLLRGPVRFPLADGTHSYNPPAGEYTLPLWDYERDSLRELGASVEWQQGFCWSRIETQFSPFVDDWARMRYDADTAGHAALAYLCKRAPNALLGKFGATETYAIVEEKNSEAGDAQFIPPDWQPTRAHLAGLQDADSLFFIHQTGVRTVPAHWRHYIVSRVNHVLWTMQQREIANGNTVAMANTDALFIEQPPISAEFGDPQVWKVEELHRARLPYARAVVGWRKIGTRDVYDTSLAGEVLVKKLPGLTGKQRENYDNST